jgi:hypothetical protein
VIRFAGAIIAALVLAAPAAAAPVTETASSGTVTARFTYERKGTDYSAFHVVIEREGRTVLDRAVPTGCRSEPCGVVPANRTAGKDSVAVRDVNGDREPDVIVDLYTGGAHCCDVSTVYSFVEGSGTYSVRRHDWADAGYRLRDLGKDGQFEFYSADARFAYRYASYAESYLPVRIFRLDAGKLVDVTPSFRGVLRADARSALRLYRKQRRRHVNVRGVLAAYAADRYRLGERRGARRTLLRALKRGDLGPAYAFDAGPFGRSYIARVDRFLRKIGYTQKKK